MRVLITGSRHWQHKGMVKRAILQSEATVIIHGGASGADAIADSVGKALGLEVISCPANWRDHGRSAGPRRNQAMLDDHRPDLVLAFPLPDSRGTWDMVDRAKNACVPVRIISLDEVPQALRTSQTEADE